MLQVMRSAANSWVVKILFVVLLLSFGVWGIGDVVRSRHSDAVATVGGAEITRSQLDQAFRQQVDRFRQFMGPTFDTEQARAMGVVSMALNGLVNGLLTDEAAAEVGIAVGDQQVIDEIHRQKVFHNAQGVFDPQKFGEVLRANSLSESFYTDAIRRDQARGMVVGAVSAGGDLVPKALADALYQHDGERRSVDKVVLKAAAQPDPGVPDAAAIETYYHDHAAPFTAPEYRALTIGLLTTDALAPHQTVTDDEIKAAYDSRIEEFQIPEKRQITQVVVPDEATARQIAAAVKTGQTLTQAAEAAKVEPIKMEAARNELLPELQAPVFDLAIGSVSEPVKTELGWHVIEATGTLPAGNRSLDMVRDELVAGLRKDHAADAVDKIANSVQDALAGGATIDELAAKFGLAVIKIPATDAEGKQPDGKAVDALADTKTLLQTAFSLDKGGRSSTIDLPSGGYGLVQVDDVTPAAVKPLEIVRDQVVAAWQNERRHAALADQVKQVAEKLKSGAPLATITEIAPGAESSTTEPLARTDSTALPASLIAAVFKAKVGEVVSDDAATADADTRIVARVVSVVPAAAPTASDTQFEDIRTRLSRDIGDDLLSQYTAALNRHFGVTVDQSAIDSLYH
ncbi:MAG: SurA N-terminal domain-containing protein [Azospirillaceae bacterium]|nr:SurA N-terminal domain-containing protein [Azospirillaceae bacterium]